MTRALPLALVLAGSLALAPLAEAKKPRVTFAKRVLTVTAGPKHNRISVSCNAGDLVKVNGRNPRSGPVACSRVAEVNVLAGDGDDWIDLRGVDSRFGEAKFEGFGTATGVAVLAGPGDDRVIGSRRAFNLLFGEQGNDKLSGGGRRDIISGGRGNDQAKGHGRRDTLLGKGGHDSLNGGAGPDLISGNRGNDGLRGGPGDDTIGGGPGRDRLWGGAGDDELYGGMGRDLLRGGPGRNKLVQNPPAK